MSPPSIPRLVAELNPEQRDAVLHTDGPLLVLAGAGTGKTRVVTVRIARLLHDGVAPENVVAMTFTNKAAREMRDRVGKMVGKDAAKKLTVSTFHSFCMRLLRRHAEAIGLSKNFTIADEDDRMTLLRQTLRESGVSEKIVSPRWGSSQISSWKNESLGPAAAAEIACEEHEILLAHAYASLADEMRRRNVVDFDDMLMLTVELLVASPDVLAACRDRFRYLMVDEYQDTNETQYAILKRLAGGRRNLVVVGDDDQSIYGWRGARPRNILDFARDFPGARTVTLARNYRSTNRILRAANSVIANNIGRQEKRLWSELGDGEDVVVFAAQDERAELLELSTRIMRHREEGGRWEDVAVLFRANVQSTAIEAWFREKQIPYRLIGVRSLFDRRECRDLLAYLKALVNPRDDGAIARVINTPPRGIGRTTRDRLGEAAVARRVGILELIESGEAEASLPGAAAASVAAFRAVVTRVREALENEGVRQGIERLVDETGYRAWLEQDSDEPLAAKVRNNIVDVLLEVAERFVERNGGDVGAFLESLALDGRHGADDDDTVGVTLLTVHAAKGLEFPHVFLIGAEETLFPHKNSFNEDEGLDTLDEERRLFYVAMTRARRMLRISWCGTRRRWGRDEERTMSRFIEEMGEDGVSFEDAASQGPADDSATADFLSKLKGLVSSEE